MQRLIFINIIISFFIQASFSQPVINEVCSGNNTIIEDFEGDYPDWIEIYNAGNSSINLSNYFISDDENELTKYRFPNIYLPAKSYQIVFASKKDFTGVFAHTNFKISSDGEEIFLSDLSMNVISSVNVPKLKNDHSLGRYPNGSKNWFYYDNPSPGNANETGIYKGYCPDPILSLSSGFYNSSQLIELKNKNPLYNVFYSIDGSVPNTASSTFSTSIMIDTNTVLRIISTNDTLLNSMLISHSYFIDENKYLPVISLITDPYNLWDWNNGIYVMGPNANPEYPFYGANFWSDKQVPVHIEYFTENKEIGFKEDFGMQMHGGRVARTRPMKALRIVADGDFGVSVLSYKLFSDKDVNTFKRFVLRNSGSDFNKAHFRDGIIHKILIKNNLNIDLLAYKPVVVYINGQYWGIHNLREKIDKYYISTNYSIGTNRLDLLEEDTIIIEGDFTKFNEMIDFMLTNDLGNQLNYKKFTAYLDIENFTDYFIAETYFNNTDWPQNNLKYWRSDEYQGKFRYIMFDLDAALNNYGWSAEHINHLGDLFTEQYDSNKHVLILRHLLKNEHFRNYFINRYADLMNTVFSTENMQAEIKLQVNYLEEEMAYHFEKWGGGTDWWHYFDLALVNRFVVNRPYYARAFLEKIFVLKGQISVEVNVDEGYEDVVKLNTLTMKYTRWSGIYFMEVPLTFSISHTAKKIFSYWQIENTGEKISDLSFSRSFTEDVQVSAHFIHVNEILKVYPNPAHEHFNVAFSMENVGNAEITLYEISGKLHKKIYLNDLDAGYQNIEIFTDKALNGLYLIRLIANNTIYDAEKILIY